ncbi:UBC-like protein [Cenococcum geophilum 1.58]|uniref:UBC-like protein n=1 Tax=Cenococcum geophilum 1.58 TaxID=794803 RepID=UPI00358F7260|nr:UBC-like protein [Cenococcum geophilum 1.58]
MHDHLPPGVEIVKADEFTEWLMDIKVLDDNPLYRNEVYRLKFRFPNSYPIEAPEVVFVKDDTHPIPWHPHIYSNGIICLDLLDRQGWSPVHNVESVCVSLQSMLTGNTKKERPPGDENFVKYNTQRPKDINFLFHDNSV